MHILIGLMFPTMIMPLTSSMTRVALPVIRNDFQIPADLTAWVAAAYTLPFMILMPLYGRLSDGVGKRRLILAGIVIFFIGTTMAVFSPSLGWLMAGRAIQGTGTAGMLPLGMALISTIFRPEERGKVLGTWGSVGPTTGFLAPLLAGLLIARWDWRVAFAVPLAFSVLAFVVVYKTVPAGLSTIRPHFVRQFDWPGVVLLAGSMVGFLFFLSSRPITGVDPLHDWRLLLAAILFASGLWWWEKRQRDPFITFDVFTHASFLRASFCGSMRMFAMNGISFLIPLYLADVHHLAAAQIGIMLMINPGAMALMVRFGGQTADRWGSRWPVVIGFLAQMAVTVTLFRLAAGVSLWWIAFILACHGLGVGLMQAPLHRAALNNIPEGRMGTVAGLYSMLRFLGTVVGTALAGILLQHFLDQMLPAVQAYQFTFLCFALVPLLGLGMGFLLREPSMRETLAH